MKSHHFVMILCLFATCACSSNNRSHQLKVTVVNGMGKGVANVKVVLGDESGAMEAVVPTNQSGELLFDTPPANATVTATSSCYVAAVDRTYYFVDIAYGVKASNLVLTVDSCEEQNNKTVDINVTNQVTGVTSYDVTLGPITYSTDGTITMDVYELQDDGNISVLASGYDDAGALKGYGFALDRPVGGSAIDVAIDRTDVQPQTHHFANVPANAVSYQAFCSLYRKHCATNAGFNFSWDAAPKPDSITTYAPSGFADSYLFGAMVALENDDGSDTTAGLGRYLLEAAGQLFDFSLLPRIPTGLSFTPGENGRPTISWSNIDMTATAHHVQLMHSSSVPQKTTLYCSMTAPSPATTLVFPELPDELAPFRPVAYKNLSLQTMKFDRQVTYSAYLKAIATHSGRFYEAAGLNSYAYARIAHKP